MVLCTVGTYEAYLLGGINKFNSIQFHIVLVARTKPSTQLN
jgi:hypothetical protein